MRPATVALLVPPPGPRVGQQRLCASALARRAAAAHCAHPPPLPLPFPFLPAARSQLYIAALNVLVGIARAPHLHVRAVTYHGIGNEWLDWLRAAEVEEAAAGR